MPAKTDERLAGRDQSEARRQAMLTTRSRREDTRRKTLVGAVVARRLHSAAERP